MAEAWIILGIALIVALVCTAGIFLYGKKNAEWNALPLSTDDELSYALKPRDLTEKEKFEATLKGAFSHFRLPIK